MYVLHVFAIRVYVCSVMRVWIGSGVALRCPAMACLSLHCNSVSSFIWPSPDFHCLALPRHGLPGRAAPQRAVPCLALPCIALPYMSLPNSTVHCLGVPGLALHVIELPSLDTTLPCRASTYPPIPFIVLPSDFLFSSLASHHLPFPCLSFVNSPKRRERSNHNMQITISNQSNQNP